MSRIIVGHPKAMRTADTCKTPLLPARALRITRAPRISGMANMMSVKRESVESSQPPLYPETEPSVTVMSVEKKVTKRPIETDVRAPQIVRA